MFNVRNFSHLLTSRLFNLKELCFHICNYGDRVWRPSFWVDGHIRSTNRIIDVIHILVDNLPQLTSLRIFFQGFDSSDHPCFPHLIRRGLHERSLTRSYRLQCFLLMIKIWL